MLKFDIEMKYKRNNNSYEKIVIDNIKEAFCSIVLCINSIPKKIHNINDFISEIKNRYILHSSPYNKGIERNIIIKYMDTVQWLSQHII